MYQYLNNRKTSDSLPRVDMNNVLHILVTQTSIDFAKAVQYFLEDNKIINDKHSLRPNLKHLEYEEYKIQ